MARPPQHGKPPWRRSRRKRCQHGRALRTELLLPPTQESTHDCWLREGEESADDAVGAVFEVDEDDVASGLEELEGGDECEPGFSGFGFAGDGVHGAFVD